VVSSRTCGVVLLPTRPPSSLVVDSPDIRHPIEECLDNLYVDTVYYDLAALEYCY
jgi:hypothetical protein